MIWSPNTLTRMKPRVAHTGDARTFSLAAEDAGVAVRAEVWIDLDEHARRVQNDIGAVLEEHVLGALISLSDSEFAPVEDRFLRTVREAGKRNLAVLFDDPDGGTWAKPTIGPPLELVSVEVHAETWGDAFEAVNRWAGYSARTVRLPGQEALDPMSLSEASLYGIGVTVGPDAEPALEPLVFMPTFWSSARWLVAERLYAELARAGIAI